jgi:[ribosomal protein S5]-alanine N-acetyltransferase
MGPPESAPAGASRPPIAPQRLETDRMVGERLTLEHAPELRRLLFDPRVMPTMWGQDEPMTEADFRAGMIDKLAHWERHGFGQWLLRDRSSGEMVGRGGPQWTYASGIDEVEIGWVIVPARWRQGLATELAWASLDVAFGPLGRREVIAYTLPDNVASRRVMEKTGFVYEREIVFVALRHVLYRKRA